MTVERKYPEHEKLSAVSEKSQAIGEFLDTCGFRLCYFQEAGESNAHPYVWIPDVTRETACNTRGGDLPDKWDAINGDAVDNPEYEIWEDRWVPLNKSIERLLADYFEIDLDKIEAEKKAMLETLRSLA